MYALYFLLLTSNDGIEFLAEECLSPERVTKWPFTSP